ncbi:transposase [Streptomyces sp. ISL-100]|nr:transposase [Streptomyces sp. ISL-100]
MRQTSPASSRSASLLTSGTWSNCERSVFVKGLLTVWKSHWGEGHGVPFITPGQAGDAPAFPQVMARLRVPRALGRPRTTPDLVLADKAYSSRAIRTYLRRRGIRAVIPQPANQIANRKKRGRAGGRPPAFDRDAYKRRTWSNGPSTSSSSGAVLRPATTRPPPSTSPPCTSRASSSGPRGDPEDLGDRSRLRPQAGRAVGECFLRVDLVAHVYARVTESCIGEALDVCYGFRLPEARHDGSVDVRVELQHAGAVGRSGAVDKGLATGKRRLRVQDLVLDHDVHGVLLVRCRVVRRFDAGVRRWRRVALVTNSIVGWMVTPG